VLTVGTLYIASKSTVMSSSSSSASGSASGSSSSPQLAVKSMAALLGPETRGFMLSDWASEVSFGIRNVPTSLSLAVGSHTLQLLLYVPENVCTALGDVVVREASFSGVMEEGAGGGDLAVLGGALKPSVPVKMKRNFSLDEGVTAVQPTKGLQRSMSTGMDSSFLSSSPSLGESLLFHGSVACTKVGDVKFVENLRQSR
jgi:hypothetical protein